MRVYAPLLPSADLCIHHGSVSCHASECVLPCIITGLCVMACSISGICVMTRAIFCVSASYLMPSMWPLHHDALFHLLHLHHSSHHLCGVSCCASHRCWIYIIPYVILEGCLFPYVIQYLPALFPHPIAGGTCRAAHVDIAWNSGATSLIPVRICSSLLAVLVGASDGPSIIQFGTFSAPAPSFCGDLYLSGENHIPHIGIISDHSTG